MNLFDIVSSAQGGNTIANLAKQFGLDEKQSSEALNQLLPAFSTALKRKSNSANGLGNLLSAASGAEYERVNDQLDGFEQNDVEKVGREALGNLFESKDVSLAVVEQVASKSGISIETLKSMLPYVASLVMGAISKNGQKSLGDLVGQLVGGEESENQGQSENTLESLTDILKGNSEEAASSMKPDELLGKVSDTLSEMFDTDGDGSAMDDIFDSVLGKSR
jgi:hypothetical protein